MQANKPTPEILFQDDDFIMVNKPANLLSVPGRGTDKQDCVISRLQQEFPTALTVHRLDYDTSGIILLALNKKAQSEASKLFQSRTIEKTYLAVVSGHLEGNEGRIDLPMRCDIERRPLQIIDHEQGKNALTFWRLLEKLGNNRSRIELKPHTGRSHQLRLHMSTIGHPVIGDNLYGDSYTYSMSSRLLLHASELGFQHPFTGKTIQIQCPAEF